MSRSGAFGFVGLFLAALFVIGIYLVDDKAIAAEPLSITIESNSTGLNALSDVSKVYNSRKIKLTDNLNKQLVNIKDKEQLESFSFAFDSLECMEESMKQYPKLLEVIDGKEKSAQDIYREMEGNCVEDVLVYLKRNYPEKYPATHKIIYNAGFVIPQIEE